MEDNSTVSIQIHSCTLVASMCSGVLRLSVEPHHRRDLLYVQRFTQADLPQQLQAFFESVGGLYEYIYRLALKGQVDRLNFRNGLLSLRVNVDDRTRQLPIPLRKMREERESTSQEKLMLTSIASEPSESSRVTIASKMRHDGGMGRASMAVVRQNGNKSEYPAGARLKLMMLKQSKMKRGATRAADTTSVSATQVIREFPYTKPQTIIHRYGHNHTEESRKSTSQPKQFRSRALSLKQNVRDSNLDLSNKDLKWSDVKEVVSYDWSKLVLLNIGYNNIATEGFRILTGVAWPALKTLYACFNNITKIQWTPSHLCFLKTLSLSGNKIREIPRDITELQFLQEFFIYNNKIEVLPDELLVMQQLKNFSIYGNKLDPARNKKLIAKLKSRKVQVWQ